MRTKRAALAACALLCPLALGADPAAVVQMDFDHPGLTPSHWTLTIHADGSGHFRAGGAAAQGEKPRTITVTEVDREVSWEPGFAAGVLARAQRHRFFQQRCESRNQVAFTGTKTLRYDGPGGQGACTFNYSDDKEIQDLSEELRAAAEIVLYGARLEMLLQHDRLGLDAELESLEASVKEDKHPQLCAIREILQRLASDTALMERVRKRARGLLALAAEHSAH
jgi:hypothetical protein